MTVTDTYNKVGELTGQSGTGADAATPTQTLGYDVAGDLTSASTSNTAGSGSNATSDLTSGTLPVRCSLVADCSGGNGANATRRA